MSCANDVARHTDGALNIALGKMVNTWGFGPIAPPDLTPDVAIQRSQAALAAIGSFALRLNPPSVRKDGDIAFDLSALAKGFAVDQAANAVRALGIDSFLIEAAGEIYAEGFRPDGSSWRVGLELPVRDDQTVFDYLNVDAMAVATTGGYRNQHDINGAVYSHTISPLTGCPIESDLLSVTVLHTNCMQADAFATAIYVLGPDAGPQFAHQHEIAALFMIRTKTGIKEIRSEGFVSQTT
jgi:thiamine biosynthesis lipoprotein